MPPSFTASFAARLDRVCAPRVIEARDGDDLRAGHVYIAPGGEAHLLVTGVKARRCSVKVGEPVNGHRPSVDVLFESVADIAGPRAVGVILTGMGRDGARGLLAMRNRGAYTIGQDQDSSVVYGMPRAAQEIGAVTRQMPLHRIPDAVLDLCQQSRRAG